MTVVAKTTRVQYTGTGLVKTYAYGWKILDGADLVVVETDLEGVDTTLSLSTDYTVSGAGTDNGGNVVLSSNLASGYLLTIYLDMDIEQPTDLTNQASPFLDRIEGALDRQALISQQLSEALGRCIKVDPESTSTSAELQVMLESVGPNAASASASASSAAASASLATTTLGMNRHSETVSGSPKTTFTLPWSYDHTSKAITVYIDGVYQGPTSFSCPSATTVTLDASVAVGETVYFEGGLKTFPDLNAYTQQAIGSKIYTLGISENYVATSADVGKLIAANSPSLTLTLPLASSVRPGSVISTYANIPSGIMSFAVQGSDKLNVGGEGQDMSSASLNYGEGCDWISDGFLDWYAIGRSSFLGYTGSFTSSIGNNGYQKLPSGVLVQWGRVSPVNANSQVTITFPTEFPTATLCALVSDNSQITTSTSGRLSVYISSKSQIIISNSTSGNLSAFWLATGH